MNIFDILRQFFIGLQQTTLLEFIGVLCGIASVWYSKKENILVYPVGLINNLIYVYISINGHLLGEASVNGYYAVLSIYGWILWQRRDQYKEKITRIGFCSFNQWVYSLLFFLFFYCLIFFSLTWAKSAFVPQAIPWADAFASSTAYTAMYLMAKKKVESWGWWIATNVASIPLYFIKGYVFTSFQYLIFLIIAVMGVIEWMKRAELAKVHSSTV